jgi:hypothetical protein
MDDDNPTVQEDIGYRRQGMGEARQKARPQLELVKVRFKHGFLAGTETMLNTELATELVERMMAEYVDRQPGEEG